MSELAKIEREKLFDSFVKLRRVKRAVATNTTVTYVSGSFRSTTTPTTAQISHSLITTETTPTSIPAYIITSFNSLMTTVQTNQFTSQTSLSITTQLTSVSTRSTVGNVTTITNTVSTTLSNNSLYNPDTCINTTLVKLSNGTCVSKSDAQILSAGILRNGSSNATDTANALSLYISSITNSTISSNATDIVSVVEIDNIVGNLSGANLTVNSNTSFIAIVPPYQGDNKIILGASFIRGIGGELIDTSNEKNVTQSFVSAAAIVTKESLNGVTSLNMLIVDKPTGYENIDTSINKTLSSSVIVADLQRNNSQVSSIMVSLYFNPLQEYQRNGTGKYLCSYYDINNSIWSEFGCSNAQYNIIFNRYECSCTHLTSFALLWLPQSLLITNNTSTLDAQDIATLIFQSISIICFLLIIIHSIAIRIINPIMSLQPLNLLPLISTASTTILFIFFIALSMTVYTQTTSLNQIQCFSSSSVLMFITYFLLIFMFCIKTSVGYFYYLRFVRLFPQPSYRKLFIMLSISFFISILCVILAIGFNSNSSFNITELIPYKICWFSRNVLYYFLTIPICLFLLLNILTIILNSKSLIIHARNAASSHQVNKRLKRCVIVLLSSCVTQGIGWLFGPFISFVNPTAGNVLEWFFIIFNGLEGVWSILLYTLIRSQRMDEQKHVIAAMELTKSTKIPSKKNKKLNDKDERMENNVIKDNVNDNQLTQRNIGKEFSHSFTDLHESETIDWPINDVDRGLN